MERCKKKDILTMAATMIEANDSIVTAICRNPQGLAEMLVQCQDAAIQIGTYLESFGEKYAHLINILETYCENVYQISAGLSDVNMCIKLSKKIKRQLIEFQNCIQCEMPDDKREVVFLPYKASMWDSLESVWKAADADENTDVYVIPIPYYDKNPDGSLREEHYEGDLYPKYVPVTSYWEYDFEMRRPDIIFIHNAYDNANHVTSVHPFFYSENLKKFTDRLVYIPYFVLGEIEPNDKAAVEEMAHFCTIPGIFYADKVIVQSEGMRQIYINVLTEEMCQEKSSKKEKEIRQYWKNKIDGSGSPKFDKVFDARKEELEIPEEWKKIIKKPDGTWKKIILYNTTISSLLKYNERMLRKVESVLRIFFENREEIALLWRPHPLIESTLISMRPQLCEKYKEIKDEYVKGGWGIYDDTSDLNRAIILCDGYYGDQSSVVQMYRQMGKPIMLQNMNVM